MYCVDTDFIIDLFEHKERVSKFVQKFANEEFATTYVNAFEFMTGIYHNKTSQKSVDAALQTLSAFTILSLDLNGALNGAEINASLLSQGKQIDPGDCLTAGIALANNCHKIITRNRKHFDRIDGLEVISY